MFSGSKAKNNQAEWQCYDYFYLMTLQGIQNILKAKTQKRNFFTEFDKGKRREKPRRNEKKKADRNHYSYNCLYKIIRLFTGIASGSQNYNTLLCFS